MKMEEIHKDNGMSPAEAEKLGALTPGERPLSQNGNFQDFQVSNFKIAKTNTF